MTAPQAPPKSLSVLVVTDDDRIASEARFGFPSESKVVLARDARQGWKAMRSFTPSVVILDIQTGSAGGYGLARDMAADRRLARVPILMLLERPQDDWLARQAGAAAVRVKPLAGPELVGGAIALLEGQ